MKISVYWPTRKRSQSLMISMSSYIMNADNNNNIEYIVIMDNDDEESKKALTEAKIIFRTLYKIEIKVISVERFGYSKLQEYHNIAAKEFTGDCLLERNDDHFCITRGWDSKLRETIFPYKNEPILIHQKGINENVWWATAPGINRKWYDISTNNGNLPAFCSTGIDVDLVRIANETGTKVVPASYTMMSMQRGEEHASKFNTEQLPDDEVLDERRNSPRTNDPELRLKIIENLKNWK